MLTIQFVRIWGDEAEDIRELDRAGETIKSHNEFRIYPANQYVTTKDKLKPVVKKKELDERVKYFEEKFPFEANVFA